MTIINKVLLVCMLFGSVFACGVFTDAYILPKWLLSILSVVLSIPIFLTNGTRGIDRGFVSVIFSIIAVILTAMCFYAQVTCTRDAQNAPIATYDNVAGVAACLCPMLTYIVYGYGGKANVIKKVSVPLIIICVLSLKSRAGILASFFSLMLYIFLNRDSMGKMDSKTK